MTNSEERSKFECPGRSKALPLRDLFRISDFFRPSDFGFRISKSSLAIMIFASLIGNAHAQFTGPQATSARSMSGQFIVRSLRGPVDPKPAATITDQNVIR